MIKRTIEAEIKFTPYELAKEFCDMDGDEQAIFLNSIEDISSEWDCPFEFQLQNIIESKNFLSGAKNIMRKFGEYAE